MTRKDYILLADAIRNGTLTDLRPSRIGLARSKAYREQGASIANRIADALESDNPNFDRKHFMQAAGFAVRPAEPGEQA